MTGNVCHGFVRKGKMTFFAFKLSKKSRMDFLRPYQSQEKNVLTSINMRFHEVLEAMYVGGLWNVLSKRIYFNKSVTLVEMDLGSLPTGEDPLAGKPYEILRLTPEMITNGKWPFPVKSRQLKAYCNLKEGLRGYALVRENLVVGDIWCACPVTLDERVCHSDIEWLGIDNKAGEVYAFDMYIDPRERGNSLAAPFQKTTLQALKADGYSKVYGYYWTDYLPALWMHRLLKWRERGRIRVWRFFSVRRVFDN